MNKLVLTGPSTSFLGKLSIFLHALAVMSLMYMFFYLTQGSLEGGFLRRYLGSEENINQVFYLSFAVIAVDVALGAYLNKK